jgi:hemolysin activation/secretion protein
MSCLKISGPLLVVALMAAPAAFAQSQAGPPLRDRLPDAVAPQTGQPGQGRTPAFPSGDGVDPGESPSSGDPAAGVLIKSIVVNGAYALTPEDLEPVLARYRNRGASRNDLAALAGDLTGLYRAQGYFLSRAVIPPQEMIDGALMVNVEEGVIAAVTVEGGDEARFKPYFEDVMAERPARRKSLERALAVVGGLAGVTVRKSRIAPYENRRGEFRLFVSVAALMAEGLLHVDNRGEGGGDALQLSGSYAVNEFLGTGSSLELSFLVDPVNPAAKHFAQVTAATPLGLRGSVLSVSVAASAQNEGDFATSRYRARGTEIVAEVAHPVYRDEREQLWVRAEAAQVNDYDDFRGVAVRKDELAIGRVALAWWNKDTWDGKSHVDAGVTFGRDGFATGIAGHPLNSPEDRAAFTKFTLSASRTQELFEDWSLFAALRGQFAADQLPDGEQIAFGGARWGRAYDYGEIEGDSGAAGQVEVRYAARSGGELVSLEAYAYGDVAAVWHRDGEGEPDSLSSAGLGVRALFGGGFRAALEAAMPLTLRPESQDSRHPRLFASLSQAF